MSVFLVFSLIKFITKRYVHYDYLLSINPNAITFFIGKYQMNLSNSKILKIITATSDGISIEKTSLIYGRGHTLTSTWTAWQDLQVYRVGVRYLVYVCDGKILLTYIYQNLSKICRTITLALRDLGEWYL